MILFKENTFKALLLNYIIRENNAFSTIKLLRLRAILKYLNLAIKKRGYLLVYKTIAA